MRVRCISCGVPIDGVAQLCGECAEREQQRSILLPGQIAPVPDELHRIAQAQTSLSRCRSCGEYVATGADICVSCGKATIPGVREFGGFWARLAAAIIDWVIVGTVEFVIAVLITNAIALIVVLLAFGFVYTVGFWVAVGATPGKMAMGLKVEMADGEPITVTAAVVRYVGYAVSAFPLLLGFLPIAITREKRGLHDYLAGTVLITSR